MIAFWDLVALPLCDALGPKAIAEIGAYRGTTTERLAEWASSRQSTVHVVDPAPQFALDDLPAEHRAAVKMHRGLSLEVLPRLPELDLVLVDGDHNWYTVFHELALLKDKGRSGPPLVLGHDVCSYGRRDMYYDPSTIPEQFTQRWRRSGLLPGSGLSDYGTKPTIAHAEREGGPRNGVLTAYEDFLADNPGLYEVRVLPAFSGLIALIPVGALERDTALRDQLARLDSREFLCELMARVESNRMSQTVGAQAKHREWLERVESSASWRLTRPLRWMGARM
ncbi:MAG: class I SAM-dependent methyltransferase [Solirubrobacterales bacterium]